jgi:acetylornithine deacetylase/succinyl-diaminopimelate desuccinylase-like protein
MPLQVAHMTSNLAVLRTRPDIARALAWVRANDAATLTDMVQITEIPAPSGGEGARAMWFRARLLSLGFEDADFDSAGNVIARWTPEPVDGPAVVLAAHLDTVFAEDTILTVITENGLRRAPGIADNSRGLAALLAVGRALRQVRWSPGRPVVLVGTVGEEGAGNLRGVKHLLREGAALRRAAAFIAVDGSGRRQIVHRAVGSMRMRFDVSGPGGHSWADRGRPNPLDALASAVVSMGRRVPDGAVIAPTRMGGGESVNSIPSVAWLEVDVRADDADTLARAAGIARDAVERHLRRASDQRRPGLPALSLVTHSIGDRPVGAISPKADLVRIAEQATRLTGEQPELTAASTDANVPLALGIPAIAVGAGGRSGATHTTAEWYDNEGGPEGIQRLLLMLAALAE